MTEKDKKELKKTKSTLDDTVKKLNSLKHELVFSIEEDSVAVTLTATKKNEPSVRFGAFEHMEIFDEYENSDKLKAYNNMLSSARLLLAGVKLCDPKSYHNLV